MTMTKEDFDSLQVIKTQIKLCGQNKKLIKNLCKIEEEIYNRCDHRYPNKKDAIVQTFFMNICEICNWNDF